MHRDKAYNVGKGLVEKLKELIPRQQFKIPLQASIGSRIIASPASVPCAKTCWPSATAVHLRKKKLLKKQAKGKKRMKAMGKVDVPQEAFMAVLKLNQSLNLLASRSDHSVGLLMNLVYRLSTLMYSPEVLLESNCIHSESSPTLVELI